MFINRETFFGLVSFVLVCVADVPYLIAILRGTVKPHRISLGIWSILNFIFFVNQIANGGGYSAVFNGCLFVFVFSFFVLSITRGIGGASLLDMIVLGLSAVLFIAWALSHNTRTSTIIAVMIDAAGLILVIVKTYRLPETENYFSWLLTGIAGLISMAALSKFDYILYVFPVYVFVGNAVVSGAKYLGTRKSSTV